MSFWNLSDGASAAETGTEFQIEGGNLEPIPADSSVKALIDEAKWEERDGAKFISLRWSVLAPDAYKNRKIFHKLWVLDDDPNARDEKAAERKRDKARRMLAAIDANCGAKLTREEGAPTDETLAACITMRPMVIKVMMWEMPDREKPGETIRGNWVAAVAPADKGVDVKPAAPRPPAAPKPSAPSGGFAGFPDDDIPF